MQQSVFDRQYQRLFKKESLVDADWISPICMFVLLVIGIAFIYSAQLSYGGGSWKRQIFWMVAGGGIYVALAITDYRILLSKAHWIFLAALTLLALVHTPLGVTQMGATRWINVGITNYQPSEAAKISVLIMVASVLARSKFGGINDSLIVLAKVAIVVCVPASLIATQPDLGTTLAMPPMIFAMLFASNLNRRFFVGTSVVVALVSAVVGLDIYRYHNFLEDRGITAWENAKVHGSLYEKESKLPLRDYQRNRIYGFIAPDAADPHGSQITYNAKQSFITVGIGGLMGKGWLEGTQAKLGYLPRTVAHNDFIFSIIGEETGFIGGLIILGIFTILIANGFRIAALARDHFGTLLCVGVSTLFLVHVFINVGMTVGLAPVTGLPLPFLSYGGSFVLSCCILQGLIQSVYRHRKNYS
ncbi:MAG: rod shape-determining protein RodA [Opitutales bacterium]|nr:rod shape-determining protein RodA [Opitutales bacterium]